MPNSYNSNATVQALSDATAMDPKLKGDMFSRVIAAAATQHNAFEQFSSAVDAKSGLHGGVRSIFAKKTDLTAGGSSVVNFNVIGTPGGPGVMGNQELTGNTSKSLMATYGVRVGWHRDGFELDREQVEFLSAGRSVVKTTVDLLAQKMGILRQHIMMMRLIRSATAANMYRAGNRGSTDALLSTDTMALGIAHSARARLRTLGGKPISHRLSGTGSPIDGYLIYASDQAMLPIRNDSTFNTVQATAGERGAGNMVFTGELLNWGGMPWYEHPIIDESWDDYVGNPMLAKAKIPLSGVVGINADTAAYVVDGVSGHYIRSSNATTFSIGSPRYFQFFKGYDFRFALDVGGPTDADDGPTTADTNVYYAWAINPDGTCAFFSYTGSAGNKGWYLKITKILAAAVGQCGALKVGNLDLGTTPATGTINGLTRILTKGTGTANIPAAFSGTFMTDRIDPGAVIRQANANGNKLGNGFVFGSMAACYANGRIAMNPVEQTRDFGFTIGRGFETILGAGITKTPNKVPGGYLLLEHVVNDEGYNTPYLQ
jgi:hypothetical protein